MKLICLTFIILFTTSSCVLIKKDVIGSTTSEGSLVKSGDIVVTNSGNDSIVLLDSDGLLKTILASEQASAALIYNGLAYDSINNQVLFSYDHTTTTLDSIKKINLFDGSINLYFSNSNLSGTLQGLAILTDGSLVVLEGTTFAEKFTAAGVRVGAPFISGLTATTVDITKLKSGGFVVCSTGTANTVRTYTAAGVLVSTATSVLPIPSIGAAVAASSCTEDANGNIIVAYNGTIDAVRSYNSTLTAVNWTYVDANNLSTPGKLAIKSNGKILVTDIGFNHIVELNSAGGFERVIGTTLLNIPNNIVAIP